MLLLPGAGCADATAPAPSESTATIVVTAQINVAMGNTPVGQQPSYVVTGQVSAFSGTEPVPARVDSVVIRFRLNGGALILARRSLSIPFDDELPVTLASGDEYELIADMFASATLGARTGFGTNRWTVSRRALDP